MGGRAIVIGGSMAGLLAARALSARFSEVLVLERDPRPPAVQPRKGAPQGRHVHVLLRAGDLALEELFPGFGAKLVARGAVELDFARDVRWYHHGVWKKRFQSGVRIRAQSRPLLEELVREELGRVPGVRCSWESTAGDLIFDEGRVCGVRVRSAAQAQREERADLVVDASGRGSQLLRWLEERGFEAPAEDHLGIDLQYASRLYRPAPGARDFGGLVVYPELGDKRAGLIFPVEGGNWMVTLFGWLGEHPPEEPARFEAFANSLARPDLAEAMRGATPLGEVALHRFPYARWRRYDKLRRFPRGLLPLGDSVCSLDPVFGQGMSIAAKSALLLRRHLEADPGAAQPRRFLRAMAREIAPAWLLTASEDLRFPQAEGARPPGLGLLQAYTAQVMQLTASSSEVYAAFIEVMNLTAGPQALFKPAVLLRVLRRALSRSPPGAGPQPEPLAEDAGAAAPHADAERSSRALS